MMNMTKTLHLFRHGQTDWNLIRRLQGHTDIPLNEEGRKQALSLQEYFSTYPVELFFSSDLMRAKETAQIANAVLQRPLRTSPALRESHLGELEGRTRDEVLSYYGEETWARWSSILAEDAHFRLPGAESAAESISRIDSALKTFCQTEDFISAAICTHGLALRRFLHSINPDIKGVLAVPNCAVFKIEYQVNLDLFKFDYNE